MKPVKCSECKGSGVYQEYDEYDRYTVHACAKCGGSGELLAEPERERVDWVCAYCDKRVPPDVSRDELEAHILVCPKHPIAGYRQKIAEQEAELQKYKDALTEPSDADVAEAIEDLLSSYSCDMRLARMYLEPPVLLKSVGLAITALRKMVKPQ